MDIARLGQLAASIGLKLAGNAKVSITVKTGPSQVHNKATDLTTTTWATSDTVQALVYDANKDEGAAGTNGPRNQRRRRAAILPKASAVPALNVERTVK